MHDIKTLNEKLLNKHLFINDICEIYNNISFIYTQYTVITILMYCFW